MRATTRWVGASRSSRSRPFGATTLVLLLLLLGVLAAPGEAAAATPACRGRRHLGGDAADLEAAEALFRAGSIDPWYEGDLNTCSSIKETANAVTWGHTFLWEWAAAGG